jgi:YHS domain-containing protein
MLKKILAGLVAVICILGAGRSVFAQSEEADTKTAASKTVIAEEVGNTICPVSGEKIDEKMKATYEYEGKIYNFCCTSCVDEFKKDPQKYIKKMGQEKAEKKAGDV